MLLVGELSSENMSEGELTGLHYATQQPICLRWKDGVISEMVAARDAPPGLWIAPGLIDLQINGYGGIDFQQDNLSLDELESATRQLRNAGCAAYLLTLITDHWPRMM